MGCSVCGSFVLLVTEFTKELQVKYGKSVPLF